MQIFFAFKCIITAIGLFTIGHMSHATATTPNHAVILQYHHISSATPPATSTSPKDFEDHLKLLEDNRFTVKPLAWVVSQLQRKQPIPNKTAVITFDDGYQSVYDVAFPLLKKRNWPFTVFVNPKPIKSAQKDTLPWNKLRQMHKYGATIANHTYQHDHLLNKLPSETTSSWLHRIKQDIEKTEQAIAKEMGQSPKIVAYPYGEYNPEIKSLIKEMGMIGLGQHSGPIGEHSDWQALPRFPAGGIYANPKTLKTKILSLPFKITQFTQFTEVDDFTDAPILKLTIEGTGFRAHHIQCFHQGAKISTQLTKATDTSFKLVTQAKSIGDSRRSRYNCTAPNQKGDRYYWYSHPWVRTSAQEG